MSRKPMTVRSKASPRAKGFGPGGMDWAAFDALSDDEVLARAGSDRDAKPPTARTAARMRRVSLAKRVRWKLQLSQEAFAVRFGIPLGTLRDWEQHRTKPDRAAESYLKVILNNPKAVMKALVAAE